ncbi:MAG: hypothetical protein ACOY93_15275 [Bacillota bacterium]
MAVLVQTFQASLPLDLFARLQRVRRRYAAVLQAAARGDFSREGELHAISRILGHMLAKEARKSPEERGGLRMLEISMAVDSYFPEMRAWNQQAALRYRPPGAMAR